MNSKAKARIRSFFRGLLWLLTVVSSLGLVAASYGGYFAPSGYKYLCVLILMMPVWMLSQLFVVVVDALWCRKALIAAIIAIVACAPAMWDFMPLNVSTDRTSDFKGMPQFSLMTYNVSNFKPIDDVYPDGLNPTFSAILASDADVVCLQEARNLRSGYAKIPDCQYDSIFRRYPYVLLQGYSQMLFSKYPASILPVACSEAGNEIAVFRVTIEGVPVTIFSVHLQPYGLSRDDKDLYKDMAKVPTSAGSLKDDIRGVKSQLINKIQLAAERREVDADRLARYVQHYGGENAIVTGDFNDVPGCYTLRRMAGFDFKQVYSKVGFGPMSTFNADKLYFRIDHILYRGNLEPLYIHRGNGKSSDHYPLFTAFAIRQ